jgi:hypothetical protein
MPEDGQGWIRVTTTEESDGGIKKGNLHDNFFRNQMVTGESENLRKFANFTKGSCFVSPKLLKIRGFGERTYRDGFGQDSLHVPRKIKIPWRAIDSFF